VAVAEPTAREGHAVDGARRARRTSEPTKPKNAKHEIFFFVFVIKKLGS
jgi:hypothetical protein